MIRAALVFVALILPACGGIVAEHPEPLDRTQIVGGHPADRSPAVSPGVAAEGCTAVWTCPGGVVSWCSSSETWTGPDGPGTLTEVSAAAGCER